MYRFRNVLIGWCGLCLLLTAIGSSWGQQEPPARGDEAELIAVLQSDAPLFNKAKACQQLAVIGTEAAVPALAALLSDEQLSHYARFGLEPIPSSAVDDALRGSLTKLQGGLLVGVINSMGARRDSGAVPAISALLGSEDAEVAGVLFRSLGRIASPESIAILKETMSGTLPLNVAVADACLTAADVLALAGDAAGAIEIMDGVRQADLPKYLRVGALAGAIRLRGDDGVGLLLEQLKSDDDSFFAVGLSLAHVIVDPQVTEALIAEYQEADSTRRRSSIIAVLGERGDAAALPIVLQAAESTEADVRVPALRVLGVLGDKSVVPLLLENAVTGEGAPAEVALESLVRLRAENVDGALTDLLVQSSGRQQLVLIELMGRREIASAVPTLLALAAENQDAVRLAAINALGLTVRQDDLGALLRQLIEAPSADVAQAAKGALEKACQRMPDRDAAAQLLIDQLSDASTQLQVELFDLLRVLGGDRALQWVAQAARSSDESAQDVATRVLGEWLSADAAPVLLDLAKTGNAKFKVRTLRGYIRIARQLDVPMAERIAMCATALKTAERNEERNLAVETLGRYPTLEALDVVEPCLDQPNLKQAAAKSAVAIGIKLVDAHPARIARVMKKVLAVTDDAEVTAQARQVLSQAEPR